MIISLILTFLFVLAFFSVMLYPSWRKAPDVFLAYLVGAVPRTYKREVRIIGWSMVSLVIALIFATGGYIGYCVFDMKNWRIPLFAGAAVSVFSVILANVFFRRLAKGMYAEGEAERERLRNADNQASR